MSAGIRIPMVMVEGAQLESLVTDFIELVGSERDETDPAIARLAPDVYPDDAEASRAFSAATRQDLLDRRAVDAETVRIALSGFRADPQSLSETEALVTREVVIPAADVDAWMRTLTAIRLVIASRLDIRGEDDHDPDDPRYGVYDWLGYRLELVIQAADELL